MKNIIWVNILFLFVLSPLSIFGQERTLNILYSGSLRGELEPCGCSPKTDFGGVARLSGYIKDNKTDLLPYLLIDAGNFSGEGTPQGRLKTETMLKVFGTMGYDSVAFLENEMVFSKELLDPLKGKYKIPVVSKNFPGGKNISVMRDTLRINIGVDPRDFKKGELNILLTDIPVSGSKDIRGWDIIINSSGEILEEPLRINDTIVVTGYPKGKKTGMLTLHIASSGKINGFKHRWLLLGEDTVEDRVIRRILKDHDLHVAQLLKEKEGERPVTENPSYAGVSRCAECHQPFVESWNGTKHSSAFSSLEKVGKSFDPECVTCHTAGFGESGGFYSINTTPGLSNVQCEACHGPGIEHISDNARPMQPVGEAICLQCHTKDSSPDFSYRSYLEKIKH